MVRRTCIGVAVWAAAVCPSIVTSSLSAQCGHTWQPAGSTAGPNGPVTAVGSWDPDGAGPAAARLVIGGGFTTVGSTVAHGVAAWDPVTATWSAFGAGVTGGVRAFLGLPNGELVVAGSIDAAGGQPVANIARWDGATWSPLGTGVTGGNTTAIESLTLLPNGDLIAGGRFSNAGGTSAANIARWDGSAWSALGTGLGFVTAVATLTNGELVAGGFFGANRWTGSSWSSLGSFTGGAGIVPSVNALTAMPTGELVAAGGFDRINGALVGSVARWNGAAWSALGTTGDQAETLARMPGGQLVAAFRDVSVVWPTFYLRHWDGSAWQTIASGAGTIAPAITAVGSELWSGGDFDTIGGAASRYLARWNGSVWSGFSGGMTPGSYVAAATTLTDGSVVVGGVFPSIGNVSVQNVARWDGTTWSALGSGAVSVRALAELPGGDVVAAGTFYFGGQQHELARFDGASWTAIPAQTNGDVLAVSALPNGDLVVGGRFSSINGVAANLVARWDGVAWHPLGDGLGITIFEVAALAVLANGDLVAGGTFLQSGGASVQFTARWDGASWTQLGASTDGRVSCLLARRDGRLVAGGDFGTAGGSPASNIAQWDGSAWSPLGAGMGPGPFMSHVHALCELQNGDVVAVGDFTTAGGVAANNIARWDGTSWSPLGAGTDRRTLAVAEVAGDHILVGGTFTTAGGLAATAAAFVIPDCPATAVPSGAGCNAGAGPMVLAADTLPWLGGTFRATTAGLVPGSLAYGVLGFTSPGYALSTIHPTGGSGCYQLAGADAVLLLVPTGTTASSRFTLPRDPAFAGIVLHHQVIQIEFTANFALTGITSSNGLVLTTGTW